MRGTYLVILVVIFSFLCVTPSFAAEDAESIDSSLDSSEETVSQGTPPPHFARYKPRMPEFLLKHKEEGWVFTGFPAIGWDPDTGFNIGAMLQIYNNGKKDSPFFDITPFSQNIQAGFVYTTQNTLDAGIYYDSLYVKGSPWRTRFDISVYNNPLYNYFGIGSDGQQLTFPGTGQVFNSYDAYKNTLKQQTAGQTNERYDNYYYTRLSFKGSAEYDLLGGWLRPLAGLQVGHVWIGDYTGKRVAGAVQNPTHLSVDCNSGRAKGCQGGWDIYAKLGMTFDTRNFEPNPSKGFMWDVVSELSPKFLGSAFNYGRLNSSMRAFGRVFDYKKQRLVLAGRVFYQWQFGEVPFYSMNKMAFTDRDWTGLGGFRSIRGFRLDRFIGPVTALTNVELRYTFYDFEVWNQRIQLGLKPFVDAGRSFDNVRQTTFRGWKLGGGGGLMLIWNLATVINFDAAWSGEGNAFYMEAGAQF